MFIISSKIFVAIYVNKNSYLKKQLSFDSPFSKIDTEKIIENSKFSIDEKKATYTELLNKLLDESERSKPIFTLYKNENPYIFVSVYPSLEKNTYKDDVFLSYYFDIKNIETNYEKIYAHNRMMISYILDDEIRTKRVLHCMEQDFIEDEKKEINKVLGETEDLGEQE